jgi:hypothetical protein
MAQSGGSIVCGLYRYPVKGLSPEPLESVELRAGETVPFDRAYAIENGPGRFNPDHPQYLPKIHFLMLMRDERLATLQTKFDDANATLTILRDGRQVARGQLTTTIGRQMIEQFLAAYMEAELRGAPKIVFSQGHSFSDVAAKCVHIINLASVRELERAAGTSVNPLRFRPNIVIDGAAAWEEVNWIDKEITVGSAKLAVLEQTARCAATNVDPETGKRDMAIPSVLQRTWGHTHFGIYARVSEDGAVAIGNAVTA